MTEAPAISASPAIRASGSQFGLRKMAAGAATGFDASSPPTVRYGSVITPRRSLPRFNFVPPSPWGRPTGQNGPAPAVVTLAGGKNRPRAGVLGGARREGRDRRRWPRRP